MYYFRIILISLNIIPVLDEVYRRNIKETVELLSNVSKWKNMTEEHHVFTNLTVVLDAIKPEDLEDLHMNVYLAMINNITGELLGQLADFNLRSLLFCQLHRRVWTKHCGPRPCSLKEVDCTDCLLVGCTGYLVALNATDGQCGKRTVACSGLE